MRPAKISARLASSLRWPSALSVPFASRRTPISSFASTRSTQQHDGRGRRPQRYVWPVSTGRPGYDTPNGTFKPTAWTPTISRRSGTMRRCRIPCSSICTATPFTAFSTSSISAWRCRMAACGCRRDHAATLFDLVKTEGMANTSVSVERPHAGRRQRPGGARAAAGERNGLFAATAIVRDADRAAIRASSTPQQQYREPAGYGQQPLYDAAAGYGQPGYAQPQPTASRSLLRPAGLTVSRYYGQRRLLRAAGLSRRSRRRSIGSGNAVHAAVERRPRRSVAPPPPKWNSLGVRCSSQRTHLSPGGFNQSCRSFVVAALPPLVAGLTAPRRPAPR